MTLLAPVPGTVAVVAVWLWRRSVVLATLAGAVAYDIYKTRHDLDFSAWSDISVGFVVAFISAVLVVRGLLNFVSRNGYAPFGWWRIIVGGVALAALLLGF